MDLHRSDSPTAQDCGNTRWNFATVKFTDEQLGFIESELRRGNYLDIDELLRDSLRQLRLRAEAGRLELMADFQQVFDNVPALIALVGQDLHYQAINETYARFFGLPKSAIRGTHISAILDSEAYEVAADNIRNALNGNEGHFELLVTCKDGNRRWVESRYVPRRDAFGEIDGVYVLVLDIHERVLAQIEKDHLTKQLTETSRLEELGRVAGGIGHDFNNFLAPIFSYSELLKQRSDSDEFLEMVDCIFSCAQGAAGLSNHLLRYSRGTHAHPVAPAEVAESIEKILVHLLTSSISLRLETNGCNGKVLIDPVELEQVIMNLCINARNALPDGGPIIVSVVDFTLRESECTGKLKLLTPGQYVRLSVSDTGVGIAEDEIPHIFKSFYTTHRESGSGLGLAIVQRIVEDAGGQITVNTSPGKGTTFAVYIPMCD